MEIKLNTVSVAWMFAAFALGYTPLLIAQTQLDSLPLYYDVRNGNVTIDVSGILDGEITSYLINAPPCCSLPMRPENHTPFMEGTPFVTSEAHSIGETSFLPFPGGVYSLGDIFPAGLTEEELLSTYFDGDGGPPDGRQFNARGTLGSRTYHLFQPIYSPSPFPALNDGTVGPPVIEKWAANVSLIYNTISGGLSLNSSGSGGGTIWSYRIVFDDDMINVDQFTPATEPITASVNANSITEVGFAGIREGVHELGSVLPSGFSEDELLSLLVSADFIGEPGTGVNGLDLDVNGLSMTIAFVPEPSGQWLCIMLLLFLVRSRRKPTTATN